jgi:hypothetical protein
VAGLSVAWRRCFGRWRRSRRCRCPRWCRCSHRRTYSAAPVRAPAPGSRPLLLPVRRATRRTPPLARRRRAGVAASSLGLAQLRRLLLLPLTALSQMGWKGKTPMGLVAVDNWLSASSLAFEARRRKERAKSLRCPGLDCPGTRGGAASSLCAGVVAWARRGGKRGFSSPGPGSTHARARPVSRRAGRLAGEAVPCAPPVRCGSVDPPSGAGERERRDEGEEKSAADKWTLPSSDTSKEKEKGCGGAGGPHLLLGRRV